MFLALLQGGLLPSHLLSPLSVQVCIVAAEPLLIMQRRGRRTVLRI